MPPIAPRSPGFPAPAAPLGIRAVLLPALAAALAATARAEDPPKPPHVVRAEAIAKERSALVVPDDVWAQVLERTGRTGRVLGYTSDEMRFYGGREHLLRNVETLFRDVRVLPRESGRITDDLFAQALAGRIDELAQRGNALTDLPSGRMYAPPAANDWGAPEVLAGLPADAAEADVARALWPVSDGGMTAETQARLLALPAPLLRFAIRAEVGARRAKRWLVRGVEDARAALAPEALPTVEQAGKTWSDGSEVQSATLTDASIRLLRKHDRAPVAYGSVIFLAHLRAALDEFRPWLDGEGRATLAALTGPDLRAGDVLLALGDGPAGAAPVVIDVRGDDVWGAGRAGATPDAPLAVVVDLAGDDRWGGEDVRGAIGCGFLGLGVAIDCAGTDRYVVASDGLGRGLFGTGVLWDLAGDDTYEVRTLWGQGAAHAGTGLLLDTAGNDRYTCAEQSQGLGSTLGAGILLDLDGDDAYVCRDDGNVSALYLGQSVAMAQGCGYGRRADLGDGRSLAGGWGILCDLAGNDRYHAQVWAQGAGYWWAVGILEDRGGDDVYENGKYSSGAAAHYAIGIHTDLAGNDAYNQGVTTAKNQFQGHGRDAGFAFFADGGGNDRYHFRNNCAGSADLLSAAVFWDRSGDDVYTQDLDPASDWNRSPFGTVTSYPAPNRSFRDDLGSFGVFLDTGGTDRYPDGGSARNGAVWGETGIPRCTGVGIDTDR